MSRTTATTVSSFFLHQARLVVVQAALDGQAELVLLHLACSHGLGKGVTGWGTDVWRQHFAVRFPDELFR
jgi:hypothetical protein